MSTKNGEILLYNFDEASSKVNKQDLIDLSINDKKIKVSFPDLCKSSEYIEKKCTKKEYNRDNFKDKFSSKYKIVQQKLNISNDASNLFMKLISGQSIKFSCENSFDLYKLSIFFGIEPISKAILDYWGNNVNLINEFLNNFKKFDKSIKNSEQREYLSKFIHDTKFTKQFSSFISDFFEGYSTNFVNQILTYSNKEDIPNDKLFDYISKNKEERLFFLSFLNVKQLSEHKKNEFLMFVFDLYCELLDSNHKYLLKIKEKDQNSSQSFTYLKESSKLGNVTASYQLLKTYQDKQEQSDKFEYYKTLYNSQTKLKEVFDDIKKDIQEPNNSNQKVSEAMKKSSPDKEKDRKVTTIKDTNKSNPNSTDSLSQQTSKKDQDKNQDKNKPDSSTNPQKEQNNNNTDEREENVYDDDDDIYFEEEEDEDERFNAEDGKTPSQDKKSAKSDSNNPQKGGRPISKDQNNRQGSKGTAPTKRIIKCRKPFTAEELKNQKIWKETSNIISTGIYIDSCKIQHNIKKNIEYCNDHTCYISKDIKYDDEFDKEFKKLKLGPKDKKEIYNKIEVSQSSTFGAARKLKSQRITNVCALNFASATKPGGGVINGRTAQEETLSRQSSLYSSISKQTEFYNYHKTHQSSFYTHSMIYSPNVVVFRDDEYRLIEDIRVSVITSAAPNYTQIYKTCQPGSRDGDILRCMKNRCRKILQVAIKKGNKAIVLGAFGCGVFGNKPEDVSKIFKEILIDEFYGIFFDKIVFAIKQKPGQKNHNYTAFKNTFTPPK